MHTYKIDLYPERGTNRVSRVLFAQPQGIDGPYGDVVRLKVTTPRTLPKDSEYREGPEYSDIDIGVLRFYGHVVKALAEFRPSVSLWGWAIWPTQDEAKGS